MSRDRWARLNLEYMNDQLLRACQKESKHTFAIWPALICLAKKSSHHKTNPSGEILITLDDLSHLTMVSKSAVKRVLDLLVEADFIEVFDEQFSIKKIILKNFAKHQTVSGSSAERMERKRGKVCRENIEKSDGVVTDELRDGDEDVTPLTRAQKREEIREKKVERKAPTVDYGMFQNSIEIITTFAADSELDLWYENLVLFHKAHSGTPIEHINEALLLTKAYADEKLGGKIGFQKGYQSFQTDLKKIKRDAHNFKIVEKKKSDERRFGQYGPPPRSLYIDMGLEPPEYAV